MSVHQSPHRLSARSQNTSEDGTDEDEQLSLHPADRNDRRGRALRSRRLSPQDQHPRHIQLNAFNSLFFAARHDAAIDAPSGPYLDAPPPADNAGKGSPSAEHATHADNAGEAALPPSQHHLLPTSIHAKQRHATRATQEPLQPLAAYTEADGQGRNVSFAVRQATTSARRSDHQQRQHAVPDPGGRRRLSSLPPEPAVNRADREQQSAHCRTATPYKPGPYAVKPLDIPIFDGDARKYPRFREVFEKVIGSHPDLSPSEKLLYLRMHLRQEPLEFAERYMVTDRNYALVINSLDERYGISRVSHVLWQDLIDIQPASEELQGLRRLHHQLDGVYHSLRAVGETLDGNAVIEKVLAKKMPKSVRLDLVRNYGYIPESSNIAALLECLRKYCRDAEWSDRADRLFEDNADAAPAQHSVAVDTSDLSGRQCWEGPELSPAANTGVEQRVAAAIGTTKTDLPLQERRTCPLCGQLHSAADCTVYDTTNRRLRLAMKLNLCLLCLREGHPAVSCPQRITRPCNLCRRGQHNRALCKDAADANHRKDRRPSPVCATRDSCCDPKASDQRRHSRPSARAKPCGRTAEQPVIREVTCCVTTATTLRQSGTQSSHERTSGNLMSRKKRPKELGTAPPGRTGTNRPPTISTDESVKQKEADAHGRARRLPGRESLLQTDKSSTHSETMQFDRTTGGGSDGVPTGGMRDEKGSRELFNDEDASHKPSNGHRTDPVTDSSPDVPDETRFPPQEESTAYVACADSDEQPAVLHECLAVRAMNPATNKSCRAVIMFDSGSSSSQVSTKLAHLLDPPHGETRVQNVSIFGSMTPRAVNGFRTFLVLCSEHGRRLHVNVTALDCIVPSVRTALVRDADLPTLRSDDSTPTPTREMPDLLIGQDLVHLFDRRLEPTLPNGYYIVTTCLGPTIGGALRSVTQPSKASTSSSRPAASPAAEDVAMAETSSRWSLPSSPSNLEPPTSRLHPRSTEAARCHPADNAGGTSACLSARTAYHPADNAGDASVNATTEHLVTSTSAATYSEQPPPSFRATYVLPQSPQKQFTSKPLDTLPPLLPTASTTYAEVEEVSRADNATEHPRPVQGPSSSKKADFQHNPPPPHGDLIHAPFYAAGSPTKRKARLRYCLPDFVRQILGIYTAPEPVPAVQLLPSTDTTSDRPLQAERQLPQPSPGQNNTLPTSSLNHSSMLGSFAVSTPAASATTLHDVFPEDAVKDRFRTPSVSRREFSRDLRSERGSPTHARVTSEQQPSGSAHQQPTARNAHTPSEDASQRLCNDRQPAPQPLASWPTGPPSTCLPQPLLPSAMGRVRIDPTLVGRRRKDEIRHSWSQLTQAPPAHHSSSSTFRVQGSCAATDISQSERCCNFSNLAATSSIMVKRNKPTKDYTSCSLADENYDDDNPGVITDADNTLRATRPGEVQQVLVSRAAAITLKADSDEDASRRRRQRATAPADNAGRPASETGSGARNMRNPRSPADNAGTEGSVPTSTQGPSGSSESRTSTTSKGRQRVPKTPPTDAPESKTKPSATKTSKKCDSPTPAGMGKHSTPINTTYGNSADADYGSDHPVVFDYEDGGPPFVPRISFPRRAARADLTDQKHPAPAHWTLGAEAASNVSIAVQRQAYRATQKPLKPLAAFLLPQCAFCGYPHQTFECWVYLTIAQRMGRARQLGCCFRCLGQDHESSSCPEKANNACLLCGTGEDHEAFCRRSADSCEDHEDHHVEDLPSDRFQATLNDTELEAEQPTAEPTPRPADNAGTGGGTNTVEADNATTSAGTTGKAVEVLSLPPPPPGAPRNEQWTWTQELRNAECEYHGYVNAYTVPWAYLPPEAKVHQTLRKVYHKFGDLMLDDVITEDERLPHSQAASRRAQPAPPSTSMRRTCAFCQSPHWSLKCTVYVSRNQRLRRAEKLRLCFVCLKEGHHSSSCPKATNPCKFCLKATHHQALCHSGVTNHRRTTKLPTNDRADADGTNQRKKRVNIARPRVNVCPPKNEAICFCDASTLYEFGRHLRPGVQMIGTTLSTPADTINFVCSFRPAKEVKRVIFWFSSDRASLSHVGLVRLVAELSSYYTTHYETIMQYVVVSPSGNSCQDDWTYGIFKFLIQAEVLLPDARPTMLPHDLLARDANVRRAIDSEDFPSSSRCRAGDADSLVTVEDVKHYLRVQHQLDLWSHYDADHGSRVSPTKPSSRLARPSATPKPGDIAKTTLTASVPPPTPPVKVAADNAASTTPPTQSAAKAEADNAAAEAHASSPLRQTPPTRTPASRTPKPQPMPQLPTKTTATQDAATSLAVDAHAVAAPAASTHRHRGHEDRRRRRRDHGPAPKAHGLDSTAGPSAPSRPPDKDHERNQ